MVLKAAIQALKKADVLKAQAIHICAVLQNDKSSCINFLLNDSSTWSIRQQLTNALHQVLVLDLDFALDQKVEQELWIHGFKNYIVTLQQLSKDKKNPKRSELQAMLSWCLESATGFYLTLFQELCDVFQLDLPFRRRGVAHGSLVGRIVEPPAVPPQRSSCLYICQHCLVHLGDIARYRNQRKQAENFYKQAILLSPSSGQPYNQLALLQASRGDRLSTVFYYVRSVTLTHPFPPAASNLSKTLEAALCEDIPSLESRTKLNVSEYTILFLKLHRMLQTGIDLNKVDTLIKTLISSLTALTATDSFSSHRLIQMLSINFYALKETVENFTEEQLSPDEKCIKNYVLELIAGFLNAFLLPVYTLQTTNILEYNALPSVKLILEWLKLEPKYLENIAFTSRLQIWPSLCFLLNMLSTINNNKIEDKKYTQIPLPEDRELQCFLPLDKVFQKLDFSCEDYKQDVKFLNQLRIKRLMQLGVWLSSYRVNENELITYKLSEDKKHSVFEAVSKQDSNVSDLLKELEEMKINSNTNSITGELSVSSKSQSQDDDFDEQKVTDIKIDVNTKVQQKLRTGILKPQGSLEKAREERELQALKSNLNNSSNCSNTESEKYNANESNIIKNAITVKKNRQNVAMQAILKKVEENSKQVKFQTDTVGNSMLKNLSTNGNVDENLCFGNELLSKKGVLTLKHNPSDYNFTDHNTIKEDSLNFKTNPPLSSQTSPFIPIVSKQQKSGVFDINNASYSKYPYEFQTPSAINTYRNVQDFTPSEIQSSQLLQSPTTNSQYFMKNLPAPGQKYSDFIGSDLTSPQPLFSPHAQNYTGSSFTQHSSGAYSPPAMNQSRSVLEFTYPSSSNSGASILTDINRFTSQNCTPNKNTFWNPVDQKLLDKNLPPMPPNGWWPGAPGIDSYDPYNLLSSQDNFGTMKKSVNKWNSAPRQQGHMSGLLDSNIPASIYHHQIATLPQQSVNYNNGDQHLTMRQKILKENKKIYQSKQTSNNDEFFNNSQSTSPPSYSLFNSTWVPNVPNNETQQSLTNSQHLQGQQLQPHQPTSIQAPSNLLLSQQSLFSGPGPSPLERLLEQQKQLRGNTLPPSSNK